MHFKTQKGEGGALRPLLLSGFYVIKIKRLQQMYRENFDVIL
jgi:hypothetical protein